MRGYLLMLALLCFSACKKNSSKESEIFKFEDHYTINHKFNESGLFSVEIDLKDGLHAYGPGEKIGKSLDLTIAPDGGWKALEAPKLPEAKLKNLSGLGSSTILENKFEITQKLHRGSAPGKAFLFLQVCTDSMCDRPRTHEIILE